MAASIAHLGDSTSASRGGVILTASTNVFADGRGVARVGDTGKCFGHDPPKNFVIETGSATVMVNGQPAAMEGSRCSCGHRIKSESTVKV